MAKARVAVLISGAGTNMAALLYAAKAADCPYELVLVASRSHRDNRLEQLLEVPTAAVILDPARPISGLAESQKLTARKRESLALEFGDEAHGFRESVPRGSMP